ncbi:TIGR00255 family protein [Cyclonatronum proteinivorum]|uniref:TIGR00255 family protein n=1 Tax=Cyclonatronum proteinivorum TaxID=1457365 RepID=A0A345UNY2_9BACT|nr:YicC/YloC family endoribonuclease [Cyclonatronum proteinivorum]AXJ02184.1 TIGR00255 family protein [Cyclonatronum proteinivorum]
MAESMTGFGRAQAQAEGYSVETEIRSVNNRYCDVSIKLPGDFQHLEPALRSNLQQRFERGKITVSVKLEQTSAQKPKVVINESLAAAYFEALSNLGSKLGIAHKPTYTDLMGFSDIFTREGLTEAEEKLITGIIEKSVDEAAGRTCTMRRDEGAALAKDLLERLRQIQLVTDDILHISEGRSSEARTKLHERIATLLGDDKYDKERLELEIALLADKLDITEEIVRLRSHITFFKEALEGQQSSGRKLNFLMQEMLREVNTIGSKSYSAEIAHKVVDVKEILETIREQIQNLV